MNENFAIFYLRWMKIRQNSTCDEWKSDKISPAMNENFAMFYLRWMKIGQTSTCEERNSPADLCVPNENRAKFHLRWKLYKSLRMANTITQNSDCEWWNPDKILAMKARIRKVFTHDGSQKSDSGKWISRLWKTNFRCGTNAYILALYEHEKQIHLHLPIIHRNLHKKN